MFKKFTLLLMVGLLSSLNMQALHREIMVTVRLTDGTTAQMTPEAWEHLQDAALHHVIQEALAAGLLQPANGTPPAPQENNPDQSHQ
jgi:hypothetical protein